ncbi:MAG TPA: YafY family protein [Candidatus Binatia bacterium]|nr:YafY family protein [Candidatus Binatia bacterium]
MDRTERFYRIDQLLRANQVVPVKRFLDELEISLATFKRDIEYMRSRLHAPIKWDRGTNGYSFAVPAKGAPRYELPGLWFNPSEIHALLAMEHLIEKMQPGMLSPRLTPLKTRLQELLGSTDHSAKEIRRRVRILPMGNREMSMTGFETIASALLNRRQVFLRYYSRYRGEETSRDVSPQRLVHYRDNWYLDGWCHLRDGLRSFSMDCVREAKPGAKAAIDVPEAELDAILGTGYGIFSGRDVTWAKLRFSPQAARWAASASWHPEQRASFDNQGHYQLEVPYSDECELVMDILKYGPECEVLGPDSLRATVKAQLKAALDRY